jgi:hypothetical protein
MPIEGDLLLYSETSHEHKGCTIRIAMRLVVPGEKQCPGSVLIVRGDPERVDDFWIKAYLTNHHGYTIP